MAIVLEEEVGFRVGGGWRILVGPWGEILKVCGVLKNSEIIITICGKKILSGMVKKGNDAQKKAPYNFLPMR